MAGFRSLNNLLAPRVWKEDEVRLAAYFIWLDSGCPEGCSEQHWFQARRQLAERDRDDARHVAVLLGMVLLLGFALMLTPPDDRG